MSFGNGAGSIGGTPFGTNPAGKVPRPNTPDGAVGFLQGIYQGVMKLVMQYVPLQQLYVEQRFPGIPDGGFAPNFVLCNGIPVSRITVSMQTVGGAVSVWLVPQGTGTNQVDALGLPTFVVTGIGNYIHPLPGQAYDAIVRNTSGNGNPGDVFISMASVAG